MSGGDILCSVSFVVSLLPPVSSPFYTRVYVMFQPQTKTVFGL